jgi:hypothetical protein
MSTCQLCDTESGWLKYTSSEGLVSDDNSQLQNIDSICNLIKIINSWLPDHRYSEHKRYREFLYALCAFIYWEAQRRELGVNWVQNLSSQVAHLEYSSKSKAFTKTKFFNLDLAHKILLWFGSRHQIVQGWLQNNLKPDFRQAYI